MDIVEMLRMCNDRISNEAAAEIERLRLLLIRKSEALAIVASPSMWRVYTAKAAHQSRKGHGDVKTIIWKGAAEFADPMAWAKRESEATDAN